MRQSMRWTLQAILWAGPAVAAAAEATPAEFPAGEITIHADFYAAPAEAAPAPVVILLHRLGTDRSSCGGLAAELQRAGFAALALDLRGHGESIGPAEKNLAARAAGGDTRLTKAMHRDVAGAMAWLASREDIDLARVGLIGVEAGGAVALDYAARDRSVDAVAMLSPKEDAWGLDTSHNVTRCGSRRLLFGHAGAQQRAVCEELAADAGDAALLACGDAAAETLDPAACARELVEFTRSALGERSTQVVYASINGEVYHPADSPAALRIKTTNRRAFSSPEEAEARGLRASKQSPSPGGTGEG
jgi:dienelactone hydrolase